MNLNPFKKEDKFLLQLSVDLGNGLNGGMSVNIPVGTDIGRMHEIFDIMRRVQDRQRAITEISKFEEKMEILEQQIENAKAAIVEYQADADQEEAKDGAPKTATINALKNNQQNLEKMTADRDIGRLRIESIKKRMAADATSIDDIRELNRLSVAA